MIQVKKIKIDKNYFSALIEDLNANINGWLDIWIDEDYKDIRFEWNKYIFYLDNENDVKQRKWQDDLEVFDYASSIAISELEDRHLIYQNDNAKWFRK